MKFNRAFLFGRGDGQDSIYSWDETLADHDVIRMRDDVSPNDIRVRQDGINLVLSIRGTGDSLSVEGFFDPDWGTQQQIDAVEFADGTVWDINELIMRASLPDNQPPVASVPISDQNATEEVTFTFTVATDAFVDADVGDVLGYSAVRADGSPLPSWLNFDAATRTFSGTPGNDDVGSISLRVSAADSAGASASQTFAVTVANVNDAPMSMLEIPGQKTIEGNSFNYTLPSGLFADIDIGDSLILTATLSNGDPLPSWLSFDQDGGTFSGTPHDTAAGILDLRVTATDTVGAVAHVDFSLDIANLIMGGNLADSLVGTSGRDFIVGLAGNDTLNGGLGADAMSGGAGNDTYYVDDAGDTVAELADEGTDRVVATVSHSLGDNFENLTLSGTAAIDGSGNALNNSISGNAADNVLDGGDGNDGLSGGNGDDTLLGGGGNDTLNGGLGADAMSGGAGNDTYYVDDAGDTVAELADEGTDRVVATVSHSLGDNFENLTLSGTAAIDGSGNALNNSISGNAADNVLDGGDGNDGLSGGNGDDTLLGGGGNDTLNGGLGNDTYVFGQGYGSDIVSENDVTPGNIDTAQFLSGISADQIWLRKVGNNLEVSLIGTNDKLTIQNWYSGDAYHVELFKTADNMVLLDSQVDNLVQAMAAFEPPASGQTTLPQNYQDALAPVIAANWQ